MDIRVKLVSVLPDCELLVIIDWNIDLACAIRFVIRIVELGDIRVSESLLCSQSFIWVELEQVFHQVKSVVASSREHIAESLVFCRWQGLKHSLC